MAQPGRYQKVLDLVNECKPETIIEIGVWNGVKATQMAEIALRHNDEVHYWGFDLFEDASLETDREEFNLKPHNSIEAVRQRLAELQAKHPGFTFDLVKGNTNRTLLRGWLVDFVFVDGGHSVETIRNDYNAVKDSRMIVFDDYYRPDAQGRCPDLTKVGANAIVNLMQNVGIIDTGDPVKGGGIVCLAVVRNAAVL